MFSEQYNQWNHNRAKAIIDYYGYKFFYGKKVLDLGSGHGEIAASLARLGADVTCVDARQENLNFISKKHPHLKTMRIDLDVDWPFMFHQFDVAISFGLLCHLKNYDKHIKDICNAAENVILETEVLDYSDPNGRIPIYEEKSIHDLSFHGEGSILTAAKIQNSLSEISATFKRIDEAKINSGSYRYDWKESESGRQFGNRRFWFIRRDVFIAQKLYNQEQIKKAEGTIKEIIKNSNGMDRPQHHHNLINYISAPTTTGVKLKNTALCLFGSLSENANIDFINRDICDVFVYSNAETATKLDAVRSQVEENGSTSEIELFFQRINKVNALKENYEREALDVYPRVIIADLSNTAKISLQDVINDKLLLIDSNIFVSNSLISDINSETYNYIQNYIAMGYKTISDIVNIHLNEFGIQLSIQ